MYCIRCGKLIIVPLDDDELLCAGCFKADGQRLKDEQRESAKSFWDRTK